MKFILFLILLRSPSSISLSSEIEMYNLQINHTERTNYKIYCSIESKVNSIGCALSG